MKNLAFIMLLTSMISWSTAVLPARAEGPSPGPASASRRPDDRWALAALERAWPGHPEWLAMFVDILQGHATGPNNGWFRKAVAQTRHGWDATRERLDRDGDGRIARAEFPGSGTDFGRLDRDGDGTLTANDFDFSAHALAPSTGSALFDRVDADSNGKVTPEEFEALFREADSGGLGFLSLADLQRALAPPPPGRGSSSGSQPPTRLMLIRGLFRQEIGSLQAGPALDEAAPDFTLKTADGAREITLSKLVGPRPVVLVFGNFTCGPFRGQAGNVEKLYRNYRDRAEFVMVYVREAHPDDGWSMEDNAAVGVSLRQPRTYEERVGVAQTCGKVLDLGFPLLVDSIDDRVGARYSGMPSRLYLIDREGKVAYKSGRGPFGFKPAELEQSLLLLLNEQSGDAPTQAARVPLLDDADAWACLPVAEAGAGRPLPSWARALARSLPRTTAAMLELDYTHRVLSPLDPLLRGRMRWVAADANRCAYGRAVAESDLRRVGLDEAGLDALRRGDHAGLSEPERAALAFARQMSLSADAVTDEEVARLLSLHGEKQVAAMVLLLAYANFQDRLVLSLGVPIEAGGPTGPPEIRFARGATPPPVPPRRPPHGIDPPPAPTGIDDPEWGALDFDDLQARLDGQRSRSGRIRVPSWDEVRAALPSDFPAPEAPVRIQWSLVCLGYQPELAAAWSACTGAFAEEARLGHDFGQTLFWVVTRTIHCFY